MKILHLLRSPDDARALATARAQHDQGHQVSLLLLHDAVFLSPDFPGLVYAAEEDAQARGCQGNHAVLSYDEIVRLIFEHDRVISW